MRGRPRFNAIAATGVCLSLFLSFQLLPAHSTRAATLHPSSADALLQTYAGGGAGDGGAGTQAAVTPQGLAEDSAGNLYVADTGSGRIRKITPTGAITTVAGRGDLPRPRSSGPCYGPVCGDGGPATTASLNAPNDVALDGSGDLFIADTGNNSVRKVRPNGVITTVAGSGFSVIGAGSGSCCVVGDGGPATKASLYSPEAVAVDTAGNLLIADTLHCLVRRVSAAGTITTVAGVNLADGHNHCAENVSSEGVPATSRGVQPTALAVDASGAIYIADSSLSAHRVSRVDPSGIITTYAGGADSGCSIINGALATQSVFNDLGRIAVDPSGDLYLTACARVLKVDHATHTLTTVAGNGTYGYCGDHGPAVAACLNGPQGIVVGASTIAIADTGNFRVRTVAAGGRIATLAGNGDCCFSGDGSAATNASLHNPNAVTADRHGNVFISDTVNDRVREVTPRGEITTVAGDSYCSTHVCDQGQGFRGDGGAATSASLYRPAGEATDARGNLFIVDAGNGRVRMVAASGIITTVAGTTPPVPGRPCATVGDGRQATGACLSLSWLQGDDPTSIGQPYSSGVAIAPNGTVYVADTYDDRVRAVDASGRIRTVAGNGINASVSTGCGSGPGLDPLGDDGPAINACLQDPSGLAVDGLGNLYIADAGNLRVRKVDTSGVITTVAGDGGTAASNLGEGGPATSAGFGPSGGANGPMGIALDASGMLYIADTEDFLIRKVDASGIITTVAGDGTAGLGGDGGPPTLGLFGFPEAITISPSTGTLYVADLVNDRIRTVTTPALATAAARVSVPAAATQPVAAMTAAVAPFSQHGMGTPVASPCTSHAAGGSSIAADRIGWTTILRRVFTADPAMNGTSDRVPTLPACASSASHASSSKRDAANALASAGSTRVSSARSAATWSSLNSGEPLTAASGMVYDSAAKSFVYLGLDDNGVNATTWTGDGSRWTEQNSATSPPGRTFGSMAYDAATKTVVLFGGSGTDGALLNDTWVWDGANWRQRFPAHSPPARSGASMAYDGVTKDVVLFGGGGASNLLNDTWTWNGNTWTQQQGPAPPARLGGSLSGDTAQHDVILFGGLTCPTPCTYFYQTYDLNDTWSWNGTSWVQQLPALSPPTRAAAALVDDPARQGVVLFGGANDRDGDPYTFESRADTWSWDGITWTEDKPSVSPPGRVLGNLAYDAANGALLLFGGQSQDGQIYGGIWGIFDNQPDDFWSWNGATWTSRVSPLPHPREAAGWVYDADRGVFVLFGGNRFDEVSNSLCGCGFPISLNDTWTWDRHAWTRHDLSTAPPPRSVSSIAFDPAAHSVVLFGGDAQYGGVSLEGDFLNDTWTWNGSSWTQRFPATSPEPRGMGVAIGAQGHQQNLAWDRASRRLILFGGATAFCPHVVLGGDCAFNDTWAWDGRSWSKLAPAASPTVRTNTAVVDDRGRGNVLLFGGYSGGFSFIYNDTWSWDGATWNVHPPSGAPPPQYGSAIAYAGTLNGVVLFGWVSTALGLRNALWTWDGARWTAQAQAVQPARWGTAIAADPVTGRVLLIGGESGFDAFTEFDDVWGYPR